MISSVTSKALRIQKFYEPKSKNGMTFDDSGNSAGFYLPEEDRSEEPISSSSVINHTLVVFQALKFVFVRTKQQNSSPLLRAELRYISSNSDR